MKSCRRWTEFVHAQVTNVDTHKVAFDKLETKRIAEEAGMLTPRTLASFQSPQDVVFDNLPSRFVLKATNLAAKRGVYALTREEQGFYDHFSKSTMTSEEVKSSLTQAIGARKFNSIIAEEFIEGENEGIPYDYKFYMFGSLNPYILQIDRNSSPTELYIYGENFSELEPGLALIGKPAKKGAPKVPANSAKMIEVVKAISKHLDRPFISVDVYTTGTDVYIGELTPAPGAPYFGSIVRFSDEFDVELGSYWKYGYKERGWDIPIIEGETPVGKKYRESAERAAAARSQAQPSPTASADDIAALLGNNNSALIKSITETVIREIKKSEKRQRDQISELRAIIEKPSRWKKWI